MIAVSAVDDGLAGSWLIGMASECDERDGGPRGVSGLSLGSWVKWQGQGRGACSIGDGDSSKGDGGHGECGHTCMGG